jgi:transcription-repair coupling factor (superfamily II helicase)
MAVEDGLILREGRVVWKRSCPAASDCAELAADLLDRIRAARERIA